MLSTKYFVIGECPPHSTLHAPPRYIMTVQYCSKFHPEEINSVDWLRAATLPACLPVCPAFETYFRSPLIEEKIGVLDVIFTKSARPAEFVRLLHKQRLGTGGTRSTAVGIHKHKHIHIHIHIHTNKQTKTHTHKILEPSPDKNTFHYVRRAQLSQTHLHGLLPAETIGL